MKAKELARYFKRNARVLHLQAEGLSHSDSLVQTEYNINCFNWVVGHLVVHRDKALEYLGREPVLTADERARYDHGSDPVLADGADVVKFERLLELLDESQVRLDSALNKATDDQLAAEVTVGDRTSTVAQRVTFYNWHDTFHTGQTELLRQVAGTDDKVI